MKNKLTLDPSRREVRIGDREIRLYPLEYELLKSLKAGDGKVMSRKGLTRNLWPEQQVKPRLLDKNVCSLRRKIGAERIRTVTNYGYRWIGD